MERQMILEMLADGKITVEEALELLKAVGLNQPLTPSKTVPTSPVETVNEVVSPEVKEAVAKAKVAAAEVKAAVRELKSELADEWEAAEEELLHVKETYRRAGDIDREIEDMQIGDTVNENGSSTVNKEQLIKDLQVQKEELIRSAKEQAQIAQEQMLEVRRRIKEKGFAVGEIIKKDIKPEFQNGVDIAQQLGDSLGDTIEEITSKIGPFIDQFVSGLSFGGFEGHEVLRETTWHPENDKDLIELNVRVQNGRVRVYGEEGRKDISIQLRMKIRGAKESVEQIADGLTQVEHHGNQLNIEVVRKFNTMHSVDVILYVPLDRVYDCDLRSVNGRVLIDNLRGGTWFLKTSNGRIIVGNAQAKKIDAVSSNGSLRFNAQADELSLTASNGTVKYFPPQGAHGIITLSTKNGGIRINAESGINAIIDGSCRSSKVKVNDDWQVISSSKTRLGHTLSAATVGFNPSLPHLKIAASTNNGSVKISDDTWEK